MSKIALIIFVAVCNVGASLALKSASALRVNGEASWTILNINGKELIVVLGALALYGLSFVAYMLALRKVQVSIAYPVVTGLTTLMLALAAGPLFGENMTLKAAVGICLVLFGSVLLVQA